MKTKQITDIAIRTFADETTADAWLTQYAPANETGNEMVFKGLQYTNKSDGGHYEAKWNGSAWYWELVELVIPEQVDGGAALFIHDSTGLGGALAEPTYDPDILAMDSNAKVVTSIKVDSREDTVSPNVQVTIETDGGKEYVTDYQILDATNVDSSTTGLPVLVTIPKSSMDFIGTYANDRRFRGTGQFSSKPGGTEVTQIIVSGNGGKSVVIPINRAAKVLSPFKVTDFTIENPGTNQTHVRSGQTYSVTYHFDLTDTSLTGSTLADENFPTQIILTGNTAVYGTHTETGFTRPTSGDYGTNSDFTVTVTGIPTTHASGTTDTGTFSTKVVNAENVESDWIAHSTLNTDNNAYIKVDNVLLTIDGGTFTYPLIPNTSRYGNLTQRAIRDYDITNSRLSAVNFTIELNSVDVGTGAVYQVAPATNWNADNTSQHSYSGSSNVADSFNITDIPDTGASTISNAFVITATKPRNKSSVTKNVSVRYQQNDVTFNSTGIRIARADFNRTYTFNQTTLALKTENSSNANVVPNVLQTNVASSRSLSINGDTFTVPRTTYTYDMYVVGEAGEELESSEMTTNDKSVQIKGFNLIEYKVTDSNIVPAGTHNGITVDASSYEIDLQDGSKYDQVTPPINGTALTVTDSSQNTGGTTGKLRVVLYSMTAGTYPEIYTDDGQRYIYVKNENGTVSDTISVEELV